MKCKGFSKSVSSRDFTIHLVTKATLSLLDHVYEDVFDRPIGSDFLHEFLSNPSNSLFVAIVEGHVVGMATGLTYVHPDKPRSLFINEVGVAACYQRKGIGTQLISSLLEWGKSKGCTEAWVATEEDNLPARLFYEATGGTADEKPAVVYVYSLATEPERHNDA